MSETSGSENVKTSFRKVLLVALGVVVLAGVAAFWLMRAKALPAPAKPVERMLELRQERSKDTSSFAEVVKSPAVAEALVSDVTTQNARTSPIPPWQAPYVSTQGTSTADVVVVWEKDPKFKQWAKATVFAVELIKGQWRVGDAQEVSGTVPPKLSGKANQ